MQNESETTLAQRWSQEATDRMEKAKHDIATIPPNYDAWVDETYTPATRLEYDDLLDWAILNKQRKGRLMQLTNLNP